MIVAGLLAALAIGAPAPVYTDSLPEPGLVELRLARIASRTVHAFRIGDRALLPLTQFFELAGIDAALGESGSMAGTLHPGEIPLAVDPHRGIARLGTRTIAIAANEWYREESELYLDAGRLGELLALRVLVDWTDLEVVIPDAETLPIAQQLRREAARAALLRPRERTSVELPLIAADRGRWNGFVLDYSLLTPGADPLGGSSYGVAGGTDAFGGSLELGVSSVGPADSGRARLDASWLGVWRDNPRVTQLRLGDGLSTGPRSRPIRGMGVTNAPFLRPSLVGTIPYSGRLPAGWQVELYRGGELVAFDSVGADGSFAADLPVLYGDNPVDMVAYGPFGETRTVNRTFRVSSALLPRGRFEYGLSGGACRFAPCRASGNLDLRYGVSSRWTAQAGAEGFTRDSLENLWHPYASVIGSLTNSWTVQLEGAHRAFVRSGVNYEPSLDLRLFGEFTRYDAGVPAPILNPLGRRSQFSLTAFVRPDRQRDFFYFDGSAEHAVTASGTADRLRIGASTPVGAARLLPYARLERESLTDAPAVTRTYAGLTGFLLPRAGWGRLLREVWVRAGLELEGLRRPSLASVTAASRLRIPPAWRWE
ncbi:MAG: hypothetical protein ACR2HK_14615 [Gemmatimonadales bacterium]